MRQQYRYAYPTPIHDLRQRLMMLPPEEHGGQRLLERELRVDGADDVRLLSQIDRFGNVVYHVSSPAVQESVEFTAEFTVERFATARTAAHAGRRRQRRRRISCRTALTAPDARIRDEARALAAEIRATPVAALAAEVLPKGAGQLDADGVRQWAAAQCGGAGRRGRSPTSSA